MAKVVKRSDRKRESAQARKLLYVSLSFLIIKVIIIFSIRYGGWLGSDAEGYIAGAISLLKHGFFTEDKVLSYLPAGYPILIWLWSLITHTGSLITNQTSLMVISIFQSLFYFGACAYFVEKIRKTRLKNFAFPAALLLAINPTLSLTSLVAGYESVVASCMIFSVAVIMDFQQNQTQRKLWKTILIVGLAQSLAGITQPRELLIGFSLLVLWGIFQKSRKMLVTIVVAGCCVMSVLPLVLVARNIEATGTAVLSSQLGATMSGGAGDDATGGYLARGFITCPLKPAGQKVSDNDLMGCVLNWYVHHPLKTVKLVVNKTIFFWSPWTGPLANGTMARNPWLKIDPIVSIEKTASGHAFVFGWFGKSISWIWLIGGVLLLGLGFRQLWRQGGLERELSLLLLVPVVLATLISVGTIGDHRYRVPTMGLSLFLQLAGYFGLKERLTSTRRRSALEPRGRAR